MNQKLNIYAATESNAEAIIGFNIAMALETEGKSLNRNTIEHGVYSLIKNPKYGFYLIAEAEGQAVGSLMVTFEWSDWRNGMIWWIQSVYVIPEFRRNGVYRQMYNYIKKKAAENRDVRGFRLYVEEKNIIAQKTYISLGMKETQYKMFEEMKS